MNTAPKRRHSCTARQATSPNQAVQPCAPFLSHPPTHPFLLCQAYSPEALVVAGANFAEAKLTTRFEPPLPTAAAGAAPGAGMAADAGAGQAPAGGAGMGMGAEGKPGAGPIRADTAGGEPMVM